MKKYKNILGCALALVLLVGLVIPLAPMQAEASEYTLTILNPKGPAVPKNNMPLADRQPLVDKLEARGAMGPVRILLLHYQKNQDQVQMWALGIMLQELWEAQYPGTTVEVVPIDPTGGPLTFGVIPDVWDWATYGTIPWVGTPWGPKSGYSHIDGGPLTEEPFARYQRWAKDIDFVIKGEQN